MARARALVKRRSNFPLTPAKNNEIANITDSRT
jgi:hypothetical protein